MTLSSIICVFSLAFSIASLAISLLRMILPIQKQQSPDNVGQKDKEEEKEETYAERKAREETEKFYKGLSNLLSYNGFPQTREGDD